MKKKIKTIIYIHLWIMVVTPVVILSLIEKVFFDDISDDDIKCAPKSLQTFVDRLSNLLDCWIN